MNLLQLDKLNQFYGASHTLWDIDLAVPEGECVVVMGTLRLLELRQRYRQAA